MKRKKNLKVCHYSFSMNNLLKISSITYNTIRIINNYIQYTRFDIKILRYLYERVVSFTFLSITIIKFFLLLLLSLFITNKIIVFNVFSLIYSLLYNYTE